MYRPKIKICGITSWDDAEMAYSFGADALGFIFYQPSPRYVSIEDAAAIAGRLPPFLSRVGVFVDHEPELVRETSRRVGIDIVQYHGAETPEYCHELALPYIKSVRMRPGIDLPQVARHYDQAAAILLDTYEPDRVGGTGRVFDWSKARSDIGKPIILAGGIYAENAGDAIEQVKPYALDVCSGVEGVKGKKDKKKLIAFFAAVNQYVV